MPLSICSMIRSAVGTFHEIEIALGIGFQRGEKGVPAAIRSHHAAESAVEIGFPVAVLFSWKYDITASGIRRTPAAHDDVALVGSPVTGDDMGVRMA